MDLLVLGLFCMGLFGCVMFHWSILYALLFGLALFMGYGKWKGFGWTALIRMAWDGVKTVKTILTVFVLIGILTAAWRASGTIPVIVCYAASWVNPEIFVVMVFLLNCLVSVLTGTSFGTAATMGVISCVMGRALGVDMALLGGAVLSGIYFGDRCSPVSTSALLVAQITGTDLFSNIHRMIRSAMVPLLLSCAAYALLGVSAAGEGDLPDLTALFSSGFFLHPLEILPAVVLLGLALFHVNVKHCMGAGILTAVPLALAFQHVPPMALLEMALLGFHTDAAALSPMVDGGGILSMMTVAGIVCLSSCYSEIFQKTGLLDGAKRAVERLASRSTNFAAVLFTAVLTAMISCSQTLSIILTCQLCGGLSVSRRDLALDLEDTTVVTAALIPWCIAASLPLATIGAPDTSILFAFFLYMLPLWRLAGSVWRS